LRYPSSPSPDNIGSCSTPADDLSESFRVREMSQ
jgi:hypothetical protein